MSTISGTIPRFLSAPTAKMLEQKMLRNNVQRRAWHKYQIVHDGKSWYAWYYVDLNGSYNQELKDVVSNGDANNKDG